MKKFILIIILSLIAANVYAVPKFFENSGKNVKPDPIYNKTITLPRGTVLPVKFQETSSIETLSVADKLDAVLTTDFYYNGKIIFNEGSIIKGTITKKNEIIESGKTQLEIRFTNIITLNNENIPISATVKTEDMSGILTADKDFSLTKDGMYLIIMQPVTYIKK